MNNTEMMDLPPNSRQAATIEVTQLLRAWRAGDREALARLTPLVYRELKRRAGQCLKAEGRDSLQGTDLVHEAFLRLVEVDVSWQDRAHFLALAARSMRRILVDRARERQRLKRGGGAQHQTLTGIAAKARTNDVDRENLLALDQALDELKRRDQTKAQILELAFFGGLTVREIADVSRSSKSAVQRDLAFAKAWLHRRLSG